MWSVKCRVSQILHLHAKWTSDTYTTRAAPATQNEDGGLQSAALARKSATHRLKTMQKYCACHTKRLWTLYQARENDRLCSFFHRHGAPQEQKRITARQVETQNKHVVRDFFFKFSVCSSKSRPQSQLPRNPCFMFVSHVTKRQASTESAHCHHLTQP